MDQSHKNYAAYLEILKEELVPAMGCTEPIAIAYAAAKAREVLGTLPDRVEVIASDNIIKNVKSVVVPNTGNLRGIEASAVAGVVAGEADKILEVISAVTDDQRKEIKEFLTHVPVAVSNSNSGIIFDLVVTVAKDEERVSVRISHYHTNVVSITRNQETVFENTECEDSAVTQLTDYAQPADENQVWSIWEGNARVQR